MKIKKIISSLLAAVMLSLSIAESSAAAENAETPPLVDVFCPVNDDSDFPFNIDVDVVKDSINYIYLDEPIYGFDYILNDDLLDLKMIFSLKEDYYDWYDFRIFNYDYSSEIFSEFAVKDKSISISGMSVDETYKFSADLNSCCTSTEIVGEFTIHAELDGSL